MRLKKVLLLMILSISLFNIKVFAFEKTKDIEEPIFMGKVIEVMEPDPKGYIKIRVKGFIKGCDVYPEEIIGIISDETKVIPNGCGNVNKDTKLNLEIGDIVYIRFSNAMTKSIPPQSSIKEIQVTKSKD